MRNTVFDAEPRTVVDFKAQKKSASTFSKQKKTWLDKQSFTKHEKKNLLHATKFEKQTIKYRENDEKHASCREVCKKEQLPPIKKNV